MDYEIYNNFNQTSIPNNNVFTKAEYDCFIDGKKVKYISEFISMIDVPYKRYKLI